MSCILIVYLVTLLLILNQETTARQFMHAEKRFPLMDYMAFINENFGSVNARTFDKNAQKWKGKYSNKLWIVTVPYQLDNVDAEAVDFFNGMISEFNAKSCIRWTPRKNENYFLRISSRDEAHQGTKLCYADVGRTTAESFMYLSKECSLNMSTAHEMLHVLGFIHEHQRKDRDCYLNISEDLLKRGGDLYSQLYQNADVSFPFDSNSLMMYQGGAEMTTLYGDEVGPKKYKLDESDWVRVNHVYCKGPHICELHADWCQKHWDVLKQCLKRRSAAR